MYSRVFSRYNIIDRTLEHITLPAFESRTDVLTSKHVARQIEGLQGNQAT